MLLRFGIFKEIDYDADHAVFSRFFRKLAAVQSGFESLRSLHSKSPQFQPTKLASERIPQYKI